MQNQKIEYKDQETLLEGEVFFKDKSHPKPAILVFHDWSGKNQFVCEKTKKLSELGYVGFAVDMYGKGKIGKTKEEKQALIQPFVQDRKKIKNRVLAAFEIVKQLPGVDSNQIGAMGFCFGGLCALDLARSGANVKGVISFHGLLTAPTEEAKSILAKILVLHGYEDPMVKPDQIDLFAEEMNKAKANWEIDIYGHTMHSFTNPESNDPSFGTVYNKQADIRSWNAMQRFFSEVFTS